MPWFRSLRFLSSGYSWDVCKGMQNHGELCSLIRSTIKPCREVRWINYKIWKALGVLLVAEYTAMKWRITVDFWLEAIHASNFISWHLLSFTSLAQFDSLAPAIEGQSPTHIPATWTHAHCQKMVASTEWSVPLLMSRCWSHRCTGCEIRADGITK